MLAFVNVRTNADIPASMDHLLQFEQAFDVQSCLVIAKENTTPCYNNDESNPESTSMKNTVDQYVDLKDSDVKSLRSS